MLRRADEVLAGMGPVEEAEVYVSFRSISERAAAIEEKKAEMVQKGWTYLRLKEAPVHQTIKSWGGGLMLQFVRPA
jgi:hypothetical protein